MGVSLFICLSGRPRLFRCFVIEGIRISEKSSMKLRWSSRSLSHAQRNCHFVLGMTILVASCVCAKAERLPQIVVERMTPSGGVICLYDPKEKSWKEVVRGSDPALSVDGQYLAYTHYAAKRASHDRYVRILDLETKKLTPIQEWKNTGNQYRARWAQDGTGIYFNIFAADASGSWNWATGFLKYPDLAFTRIQDEGGSSFPTAISRDGKYRLITEAAEGYPPLAFDTPTAVFLEDITTKAKVRITPKNFWVPSPAQWLGTTGEILIPGVWHEDYGKVGTHYIYRIKPNERDWAIADKQTWIRNRFTEGFQVSASNE